MDNSFQPRFRKIALTFLVFIFLIQSYWVYTDQQGQKLGKLSPKAAEGKKIWQEKNCQTCHQIYGLGGFLGPDLTNIAPFYNDSTLRVLLQQGTKQMPAFEMSADEVQFLFEFLKEIHQTGIGKLKQPTNEIPWFEYQDSY